MPESKTSKSPAAIKRLEQFKIRMASGQRKHRTQRKRDPIPNKFRK